MKLNKIILLEDIQWLLMWGRKAAINANAIHCRWCQHCTVGHFGAIYSSLSCLLMCANISTTYTFPSMVKIKVKTTDGVRKGQGKERSRKREGERGNEKWKMRCSGGKWKSAMRDKVFKKMFGYICCSQHAKKQMGADFKSHLPSLNHLCSAVEVTITNHKSINYHIPSVGAASKLSWKRH